MREIGKAPVAVVKAIAIVICVMGTSAAAFAERFVVQIDLGDGSPITLRCEDSNSYARKLDPFGRVEGIVPAPATYTYDSPVTAETTPGKTAAVSSCPKVEMSSASEQAVQYGLPGRLAPDTRPVPPPTAEFVKILADAYRVTNNDDVQGIWRLFVHLPDRTDRGPLAFETRVENAVVAYGLGHDPSRRVANTSVEGLSRLIGDGARVRAGSEVSLRTEPWGDRFAVVSGGATVDLMTVPDEEGWCRVRRGGQEGWVSGLFLDP